MKIALKIVLIIVSFSIIDISIQCAEKRLLLPSEVAGELKSNKLSMDQKIALLQIVSKNDISLNAESKTVIKKFLLKLMTSYEKSQGRDSTLSRQKFIDLFRNFEFRLSKSDLKQFFTKTSLQGSNIQVFEDYLTLFFENGLYTDVLYNKLDGLLNSKISLAKKGFLLQLLNNPPYKKQDISRYDKQNNYYADALSYYSEKSSLYDSSDFEKKYDEIFYNTAVRSDQFLREAGVIKEICWDGFVLSAEDTISSQKLIKLFVKRLRLIVASKHDSIIIQYLESLNSGDTGELDMIPESALKSFTPLLKSKNNVIVEGIIAILKEKTDKDFNSPEEWKKAIAKMPGAEKKDKTK